MALETGDRIEDLVPSNPAVGDDVSLGDDHLRLIKACVLGSFPSLGSTAVSVTAAQINDVPNKLISFNGRPDVEAFPAAGDYDIDDLGDVDTSTTAPGTGDYLQFDGTNWVPVSFVQGVAQAQITAQTYGPVSSKTKLELDVSNYASTGMTVDTTNNRITNATGETVVVIARACLFWEALDDPSDWLLTIDKNGVQQGEVLDFNTNTSAEESATFEVVTSMADGDYIEVNVNVSSGSERFLSKQGSTLLVQIIPGA